LGLLLIVMSAGAIPFLQDDAFISFRYVDNYLAGGGLVFNIGEQVEGYTNFLWVILLTLAVKAGFELGVAARWLGLVFSAGTVVVTVYLARRLLADQRPVWAVAGSLIAGLWVALNPAVHYWSVAGLETGMFLFLVTLAIQRFVAGSSLGWPLLVLASLTRPEGGLVFATAYAWYLARDLSKIKQRWWQPLLFYAAPLLPFAVFKLVYYGSIFPNPFFAKTGFSPDYWKSGLGYIWLYFQHLALWGAVPVLLLIGLVRSGWKSKLALPAILWLVFALYIVAVGGDVLHAHRFFVPIWPFLCVAAIGGLFALTKTTGRAVRIGGLVLAVATPVLFMIIPGEYFNNNRKLENGLVRRMTSIASALQATDPRPLIVAASTIGKLSYDLRNHTVLDMLGLVDSTVARHPEYIEGLPASWKERHYNASYILSRDPDYIVFSTDDRPSAPAEKALVLHSRFRRNYSTSIYRHLDSDVMFVVFKRTGSDTADVIWPDPTMPDRLAEAMVTAVRGDSEAGRHILRDIWKNGPGDFALPIQWIGQLYFTDHNIPQALSYLDSALQVDPNSVIPLYLKGCAYYVFHDTASLAPVVEQLADKAPWLTIP